MWGSKLCLLLLLGTHSLAQQDVGSVEEQSPVCFLAKRYKNFRQYVYDYEAETFNGVTGASDNKSGPKVSCKVEIDVPQTCSFIIRTTECSLNEILDVDVDGNPVYRLAAEAQAFTAAMEKNALKVTVEGQTEVKLYPEDDEAVNILNIKRGIVSALLVPVMDEEKNNEMASVHGVCATDFTVNSMQDIATDVTVSRDLSRCDGFNARRQTTSPLALISGLNYPLSKMISSTQTCNYQFDNQKKHMTQGTCTEKHIFLPFSYKNEYGISAVVKQTLNLRETAKINDRIFDHNEDNFKSLLMDVVEDKSPVQTKDAVMATLQTLNSLPQTNDGEERAGLFHKLVSELRGLEPDVLASFTEEMMDTSTSLTYQALAQCGTPACTSALLKILQTFDHASLEVDAVVYALALLPHPSRLMVKDMLSMAQSRQSKPIMYALSNAARKLYLAEGVTPEVSAVSDFVNSLLGADCAGEKELTFLTLRVLGNMGDAMEAADPAITTILLKCMRQPATTLSVQLAAIQAFRRMTVTDEVRNNLQRVSQYPKGAVQKRLAAYLMLMRNPQDSDIEVVKKLITQEQNMQVKSFVTSHIYNIISSEASETKEITRKLMEALQDTDIVAHSDFTTMSRNYKLGMSKENIQAGVQGNIIFDPSSQLPREVMLETTMEAFGFSMDIWEFGMEGKGLEPTIEALFGKNGFFPDTISKALYWVEDKMPPKIREVLEKWVAPLKSEGQKVPENLVREITRNVNKLVKELQNQDSTEAMAYLRLMGAELGYIKSSELKSMADNAVMYAEIFLKLIPKEAFTNLVSKTDNEMFAHYIFMDNKFVLPTASGMPLKFALAGTFAPGAKGGLRLSRSMNELVFMPSVGVEFRTQMGIYMPEMVVSTTEMRTTLYHESGLKAKITMDKNQIRLSIPAPQGTTKFLRISNKVMIVGPGVATVIPYSVGDARCDSLFAGITYCTKTLRADTADKTDVPYFPLNGETLYAFDIKPSRGVSEYTATLAYELLNDGNDEDQMIDSLKMSLKAEGEWQNEATATMKFNRNRNLLTTEIQIPDFDIEAGVKVGLSDSGTKGKSLILELTNKNVPQMSLIGRAKVSPALADSQVQVQLLVPSLSTDATVTATMTRVDGLTLEIKSDLKLSEMSSVQAVVLKYGKEQAEVQLVSNMNADTKMPLQYAEALRDWTVVVMDDVMNQQVPKTDMKLGLIAKKGLEANRIWFKKLTAGFPYIDTLLTNVMNEVAKTELPHVPENLFMNFDSSFKYKFNEDRVTITVPLPLGGKSSEELRVPTVVTSPYINMPQLGVAIPSQEIRVPTFTIPSEYDLTLPLMGMVEMSAKVNSNIYNWEATASVGNMTVDSPNYLAKFNFMADSPVELLSFSAEGSTSVTDTNEEKMELTLDSSLKHKLLNTGVSVLETISLVDNVLSTGRFNVHAASPLGLDTSLTITTQFTLDSNMLFGDVNTDGSVTLGPMTASTTYLHTFSVEPAKKEAKMESTLSVNSDILKIGSKVKASYENEELLLESNTNLNSGPIKHTTKINLSYKDVKLDVKCDSVTKALKRMLRSQVEFSASEGQASLRIENQADDAENRAYSLLTGSLNPSGLEINADASINVFSSLASHKATLVLTTNGLTTSCTTTAQHSPLTFENVFRGGLDTSGVSVSLTTKGAIKENKAELNVEGKLATTEVSLNSIFEGNMFDLNGRNIINFRLNEDGLKLSNNLVGSFKEIRTDNAHSLALTLRSFSLNSKTENFLNERNSYMHDIQINMERFTALVSVKNDLKVMDINFVNDAKFKAEPYNMELSGAMTGVFSEEQLKNTYQIKFEDMILSANWNTNGKLLGTHMTHTTDLEVAGLTMKFNNVANFKSQSLRLDSTVKTAAEPFTLTIDAIFNSDGAVYLYGQQSGELYGKFLLKAEPLLFTHSFESRTSTTHQLENRPTIKTMMENKFTSILSLQEQGVTLKMTSKVNENTFDQELSAYNNVERMGVELEGTVSAPLFSQNKEDYSISAFLKYDKKSDSHFIQIPFIEYLPEVIENMRTMVMGLVDEGMNTLKDINYRYAISDRFQSKMVELKEVIDNFDINIVTRDLTKFLKSIEKSITNLSANFPTEKLIQFLNTIKDTIMAFISKYDIANKFNAIYTKIEDILSSYEIEKMIGAIMDEMVKVMKQYQIREKIQNLLNSLQSIDIQPLLRKVLVPAQELVSELSSFDIDQLIEDMRDYFMRMVQKIKSFDYETFTIELKDRVAEMSKIPCFGKLYGGFRVTSPHYKLSATADLENTTTMAVTPEFQINFKSQAESTLKILDFTAEASAHFAAPEKSQLTISENIKVDQCCFTLDHKGEMTFYSLTRTQASASTLAKVSTELFVAELTSNADIEVENRISGTMETSYKHDINMPLVNIFSEAKMKQKTVLLLDDSGLQLNFNNFASEKFAVKDFSDEAKHTSDISMNMDFYKIKLTLTGETGSNNLKMIQNVVADIEILGDVKFDAKFETETPFLKDSVAEVKFIADAGDLQIDFTASHDAELIGPVEGTLSNSLVASVTPDQVTFDTKNKGNAKLFLPFRLSGKIDLQNDVAFTLNPSVQQASWSGLARFNQYKYSHLLTFDNLESEISVVSQINGEANLDILKESITIPQIRLPFFERRTPRIDSFSLWHNTPLSDILTTTQQTFDMNSKFKYIKSPEMITFDVNMEPFTNAVNSNFKTLHKKLHINKDKVADLLVTTFGKAKAEYEKYSVDFPETATVPAFKVPLINLEVSTFTVPLPHRSMISVPTLHIPSALTKLTIPKLTLPKNLNIKVPALGDLAYEFSLKTAMVTFKTDASILNQDSINIKLDASASSENRLFNGKIEGSSIVNLDDGLKITSDLSLKHVLLEGNHENAIILGLDNLETSITNSFRSKYFGSVRQEFSRNPEEGLVVSMSSPSAGHLALQVQTKSPAQVRTRLYGYYPSDQSTAIDILDVKMSVVDSKRLNIQTTWNMEIPNELMLTLKEEVPRITTTVSDITLGVYKVVSSMTISFVRESQRQFKRTVRNLSELDLSDTMKTVADGTISILVEYQKRVEIVLDAVIRFLRETRFQIPGYEQKMSGLEVYQMLCGFVADVSEEAVQRVPQYFTSIFAAVLDYFKSIEFTLPGSSYIVSGREIIDDLSVFLRKIQDQVLVTVRNLGRVQLEDIFNRFSAFLQFVTEQSQKLVQTLESDKVEKISTFMNDVYHDAVNSKVVGDVVMQIEETYRVVLEYLKTAVAKVKDILSDVSVDQFKADIQSWIDTLMKRSNALQNHIVRTLKEKSKDVEYVRVGEREVEVDLPLPNVARFF